LQCDPCFDESQKSSTTKREKKRNSLGVIIQYNTGHESSSQAGETQEIPKAGRNGPN